MKKTIIKLMMPLVAAICAAAVPLSSFAAGATLTHRWSFTSDYGGTANGSRWGGSGPSFANGQVTFPGGGWGAGSVDLGGPGLTGGGDTTIEIWAKNNALSAAEIMFEYGAPKNNYGGWGGSKQCFAYYWSDENAQGNDIFIVKKGDFTSYSSKSGIMPATVGTMYHFSFTFKADGNGGTVVNFARRNATTGALEASGTHTVPNWTLSHLESQTPSFSLNISKEPQYKPAANAYNGSSSRYSDSNATYDEVRIWNGVLSDDQLAANASMGPDAYASGLTEGFELAAGTKFNVPEEGYAASGPVTLGAGAKLRFDTASFHGQSITFSATGFNVPSGSILDYVELTDSANFTATLSGNTITVERTAAAPVDYFVDWVQPSAALYVDTEVIGKAGTKIELKMLNVSSGTWPVMLGSWKDGNDAGRFNIAMFNGEVTRWEYAGTLDQNGLRYAPYTCELTFEVEYTTAGVMNGKWSGCARPESGSVGSATVSTTKTVNNGKVLNTGLNMYLFACNKQGSPEQTHLGRLYYCKIWQVPDGGSDYVLVRDFHPCVKDGVAGLYDSVSQAIFYPPASGNALNAGPATFDPATCPSDSRVGSVDHTSTLFGRIHYAQRGGMSGASNWRLIGLNDYTLMGAGDTANLNGSGGSWQDNNLKFSQLRFDGWFQVDSSKAGTWTINQKFDDYFAFFIDTNLVLYNNSYTGEANATVDVAEGWHRFTIIAGDTYGGYGSSDRGNGVGSVPLKVTVGGNAYAFNNTNFPQGSGSNNYTLTSDEDWSDRGPVILTGGAVLDLNGHTLVVNDIACDDYVGSCITNSVANKAVLFFTGTPAETKAYKDGLIKQIDEKIILAHDGDQIATWTGAVSGDPTNANNWEDLAGQPVVPTAAYTVKIVGSNVNLQCPAGTDIACKSFEIGNCTFSVDCDWSGLSQTPTIDGTANLNGHVLTLNNLSAVSGATFSGGDGSFVQFVVDESATIANLYEYTYIENIDNLAFSGSAKIRLLKKDGNGTLTVTRLQLGNKRNGDMVQANGTVNLGGTVNAIGQNSGKTSTYTMSGGSLNAASGSEFVVGASGTGVFNQSGGSVTLNNWFSLGRFGGNGTYTITGGSLTANHTSNPMWIGGDSPGTGTFTIDPGATVTLKGGIDNGRYSGATGHIILNGGTLNVKGGSGFNIGRTGTGTFVQNGGTLTANEGGTSGNANNVWRIGWEGKGTGSYTLNDGTAIAKSPVYIGDSGTGTFTQNGGTMTAESGLTFAVGANSKATFTLSGGVLNTKSINKGSGTLNGVTLDGGTIVARNVTDGANFIKGLNNVTYGPGGLTLDTAGTNVTMATASGAKVMAAVGSTFTKTGSGTLTVAAVPPVGNMVVSNGTLALSATCDNTAPVGIAHRWSFTNDYTDSIGSSDGTAIGSNLAIENGEVVMSGNGNSTGSLNLGKGVMPGGDATIEIWATRTGVKKWARVFDYGANTTDYFLMTWVSDTDGTKEAVGLKKNNVDNLTNNTMTYSDNVKYHISVTFKVNDNGSTTVSWARRNVETGAVEKSGSNTYLDWTLANLSAGNFYIGHSQWSSDFDANAKYDEVRIWNGALSADALALSVQKGPDATSADIAEISGSTLRLESGTTLAVGSGNTLTQPAVNANGTLASGSLVVTKQFNVTPGQSMTVASGATLDLTGAEIVVTGEMPVSGCVIATAPSGGIVTARPRRLTGDLDGYALFLKSDKAYIGKIRKGVMVIAH